MGTVNFLLHPAFGRTIKMLRTGACLKKDNSAATFLLYHSNQLPGAIPKPLNACLPRGGAFLKNNAASCSGSCGVYSSPFFKQKKPSVIPPPPGGGEKRILFPIHP